MKKNHKYILLGNNALREGDYKGALEYYNLLLADSPSLKSMISFNIEYAELKSGLVLDRSSEYKVNSNDHLNSSINIISSSNENANPDFFNLRAKDALSDTLVLTWVESEIDFQNVVTTVSEFNFPFELLISCPRQFKFEKPASTFSESCKSITIATFPKVKNEFSSFVYALTEGVITKRRAFIYLDSKLLINSDSVSRSIQILEEKHTNVGLLASRINVFNKNEVNIELISVWMSRIFQKLPTSTFNVPDGSFICNTVMLKQLNGFGLYSSAFDNLNKDEIRNHMKCLSTVLGILAFQGMYDINSIDQTNKNVNSIKSDRVVKTIAFYLPQFHIVPENDKWWGKGFTEWNNVIRAKPMFRNHNQPRLPADLGFYDLRSPHAQVEQAKLAQRHGIHGFCYYYYWFDGKKVLNEPIEKMINSGSPNFPFCVCWANENWSRNWDGQNKHVLLEQNYSLESNRALILEFIEMMKDPRYIRHNGKPVLVVYRIKLIPDWKSTAIMWREECRKAGLGEIHLCSIRFSLEPLEGHPSDHELDSYVLFPPQDMAHVDFKDSVLDLNKDFGGTIFSYNEVVKNDISRFESGYPWPVHRGAMLGWDNTARRMQASRIFTGCTPMIYRSWISNILRQEELHNESKESLLFINAWNEWAEGTTLEPDQRYGSSYLKVTQSVIAKYKSVNSIEFSLDLAKSQNMQQMISDVNKFKVVKFDGNVKYESAKKTVMFCAHISGHQLFGGERSFLDVLSQLSKMGLNIVVTLPSANNKSYIDSIAKHCSFVYCLPYQQWVSNRAADPLVTLEFCNIIANLDVDVVYSNTIVLVEPAAAAKLMNRESVVHVREFISIDDSLRERIGLRVQDIIKTVFENYQYTIANSRSTEKVFSRIDKTFYVPNAVDAVALSMNNKFGKSLKFGIVSSNIPKKGVSDFIELAKKCRDLFGVAEFLVIGPENEQIKIWKQQQLENIVPNNVKFIGYKETPRQAMSELNVLLSLSSFAESFGRTVAEAMAASRPVIAYEWGAVPELIEHGKTGFLAPFGDLERVAYFVREFCKNTDLVHAMGANGCDFIQKNFSHEVLYSYLKIAFDKILPTKVKSLGSQLKARKIVIVIPVFNAPAAVKECIDSVIRHSDFLNEELLIIDDGSTDGAIVPLLAQYEELPNVTIVSNVTNLGYTKTVNKGLELAGDSDVILLNSDTIVTASWLAAMRSSAYRAADIGTVTAMSDNAGAFSFPISGQKNDIPSNVDKDQHAFLILQNSINCQPVDVPTGSGFCFFIKRALIDSIGGFDEVLFPRGYGEENDFCLRAIESGWRNVVTPWAYIFHLRTASFQGEKEILVKSGVDVITKKYPDYAVRVKSAFSSENMIELRRRSDYLNDKNKD